MPSLKAEELKQSLDAKDWKCTYNIPIAKSYWSFVVYVIAHATDIRRVSWNFKFQNIQLVIYIYYPHLVKIDPPSMHAIKLNKSRPTSVQIPINYMKSSADLPPNTFVRAPATVRASY